MILGGRKIQIQRKDRTSDGQGGWSETWSEVAYERGHLRPTSAREKLAGGQEKADVSHIAILRKGADIKLGDRLKLDDLIVAVVGIREPATAGRHLEIDGAEEQTG